MTEPSVASVAVGWTAFLTLAALAALLTPRLILALHGVRRWYQCEPISLDAADGVVVLCYRGHHFQLDATRSTWVCASCGERVAREVTA